MIGICVEGDRKKSLFVSDSTAEAEGLVMFSKFLGRISAEAGNKSNEKCRKSLGENGAKTGSVLVSENPTAALSEIPDVTRLYHSGK